MAKTGASSFDGRLRPIPNGYMKSYWRPIPFHLVDPSPLPLLAGTGAGAVAWGLVDWMNNSVRSSLISYLLLSLTPCTTSNSESHFFETFFP